MSTAPTYRVYLSSTLADLGNERAAVFAALTARACAVKQSYGASESDLVKTCREDVAGCDVYVGIFGLRYGYVPPGDNPEGKSITELELDEAEKAGLQRFLFLKDEDAGTYKPKFIDNPRTRIDALRARIGSGEGPVPFLFSDTPALELEVTAKIAEFRSRSRNPLLDNRKPPHPAQLKYELGLVCVPGTDDAARKELEPAGGEPRFRAIEVSPKDPNYLATLEEEARFCRALCWVLTPASLGRFDEVPGLLATTAARLGKRYGGRAALLLGGLSPAQLPAGLFEDTVAPAAGERPADALQRAYQNARARSPHPFGEPAVPLSYVVVALDAAEAAELADDPGATLAAYGKVEKTIRAAQLEEITAAIRAQWPGWPKGFYGARREDWRPFDPAQKSLPELLERALARLNDEHQRSARERGLLGGQSARIVLRPYSFDEWLDDRFGSRLQMEGTKNRGCLVLVDELALLHPRLRQGGNAFFAGERLAVLSANPCDPAHQALHQALDDFSLLRVGSLCERYRDLHDPRCELAIGNIHRFERWLRLVLPELVAGLDEKEPQPILRERMAEALA